MARSFASGFNDNTYRDLMRRIETVYENCGGKQPNPDEEAEDDGLPKFDRMKNKLINDLKRLTTQLQELEAHNNPEAPVEKSKALSRRELIALNNDVRRAMKKVQEDARALEEFHRKDSGKKFRGLRGVIQSNEERNMELSKREEAIAGINEYVRKCEKLYKKRYDNSNNSNNNNNSSSSSSSSKRHSGNKTPTSPTDSDLRRPLIGRGGDSDNNHNNNTDTDDDDNIDISDFGPEDLEQFQTQIKAKNEQIDKGLEQMSQGVNRLKNLALGFKDELQKQEVILEEIDESIDRNQAKLNNLNNRLHDALEKSGGVQRFTIILVLVVLILALLGVVYVTLKNFLHL